MRLASFGRGSTSNQHAMLRRAGEPALGRLRAPPLYTRRGIVVAEQLAGCGIILGVVSAVRLALVAGSNGDVFKTRWLLLCQLGA